MSHPDPRFDPAGHYPHDPLPKLQWGLPALVPNTAVAAWGGRGIVCSRLQERMRQELAELDVDLPHDRQHAVGDPDAVARIIDAINGPGMDSYRAARLDGKLQDDVAGLVTLDTGATGVTLQADTRGSCGYVYLTAWIEVAS